MNTREIAEQILTKHNMQFGFAKGGMGHSIEEALNDVASSAFEACARRAEALGAIRLATEFRVAATVTGRK